MADINLKFISLPERSRLLVLSPIVGILSGCSAVLLTYAIDLIRSFVDGWSSESAEKSEAE